MERVRRGDFMVDKGSLERARESFEEREPASRARDRALRGPIVEDVAFWEENQRIVDYPGVDTPTDEPRHTPYDFPRPEQRDRMARGAQEGDVILDEQERPFDAIGSLVDAGRRYGVQVGGVREAVWESMGVRR